MIIDSVITEFNTVCVHLFYILANFIMVSAIQSVELTILHIYIDGLDIDTDSLIHFSFTLILNHLCVFSFYIQFDYI